MRGYENKILITQCKKDGINFWNYVGSYLTYISFNYLKHKHDKINLSILKCKTDYLSVYKVKNIVQNDYKYGEKHYIKKANQRYELSKNELFEWLDKTSSPYTYIFEPCYFYDTRMFERGYALYKKGMSGVNHLTLEIAGDYALYKTQNIMSKA